MKKIGSIFIALMILIPVSNVLAYQGGELDGRTMFHGGNYKINNGPINQLTDNDMNTSAIVNVDGSNSLSYDYISYKLTVPKAISSFYLAGTGKVNVLFVNTSGNRSFDKTYTLGEGQTIELDQIYTDIEYVGVSYASSTDEGIVKEFDVFSNDAPKGTVTLLTETHSHNSVTLDWTNPTTNNFVGTVVKQEETEIADLSAASSGHSIGGLEPETEYTFDVLAKYEDGTFSEPVSITATTSSEPVDTSAPGNISNVTHVATDTAISFLYSLPVDTDFAHLRVYRDGEVVEDFHTADSFDDFGLDQNTTYTYKFVSVDLDGNESNGYVQTVSTDITVDAVAPDAPSNVVLTAGNASASVAWDLSSETDVEGYNVYVDGVKHNTALIMGSSYVIPNLDNGTTYDVMVTAVDSSDNESTLSQVQEVTPTEQAMPIFEMQYDLAAVAQGTSNWFGSLWLILAFSVAIPLTFLIARRVKGLMIS